MGSENRDVPSLLGCARNWRVSFDNEFLHIIPHNCTGGINETRPVSKACQRVTSVFDSKFSAGSSECEQRILELAASRSARWALLHREREAGFEFSQHVMTRSVGQWSTVTTGQFAT